MAEGLGRVEIPNTEVRWLHSAGIDQDYRLLVALPRSFPRGEETYPVLYVVDAVGMFGLVTDVVRGLHFAGEIPEILTVGIAYPQDHYVETRPLRARDLTPTVDKEFMEADPYGKLVQEKGLQPGGAGAFLEFIREDIMPFIQTTYRADLGDQAILGASFGGLFAAWCLIGHPVLFKRYVILSPSVSWDNSMLLGMEPASVETDHDPGKIVFLSAGGDESSEMISGLWQLDDKLAGWPGRDIRLSSMVFEGEGHLSSVPAGICRGIRTIYG